MENPRIRNQPTDAASEDLTYQIEMQDHSLLFKLRRSCQRIEQLLNENSQLRKDKQLQHKLIINLQQKQRQMLLIVEELRQTIAQQHATMDEMSRKICVGELIQREDKLNREYELLRIRYSNCEEENIILRQDCQDKNTIIVALQKEVSSLLTQIQQISEENMGFQEEARIMAAKLKAFECMKTQLDLMKTRSSLQDQQIEHSLSEYRQLVGSLSTQMAQVMRQQEYWQRNYADLSDTVEHIQDLRAAYRLKKLVRTENA